VYGNPPYRGSILKFTQHFIPDFLLDACKKKDWWQKYNVIRPTISFAGIIEFIKL
jgi:hypothetical protein